MGLLASAQTVPVSSAGATGHLLLTGAIGSASGTFVLDTGSAQTLLARPWWNRLPNRPAITRSQRTAAANGSLATSSVVVPVFRVGTLSRQGFEMLVADLGPLEQAIARPVAGILGMDFLARFTLDLDLLRGILRFRSASETVPSRKRLPIAVDQNSKITLAATLSSTPVTAMLDTGARRSVMNWAAAEQLGLTQATSTLIKHAPQPAGLDMTPVTLYELQQCRVEIGETHTQIPMFIADVQAFADLNLHRAPAMIVGMDILAKRRLVVATTQRWIAIEAPSQ